jgi:hypothetical protein
MNPRKIDHESVPPSEFKGRWRRALKRSQSMEACERSGDFEAAQILAIHAAIAAADAFTIKFLGKRCASERHEDAVDLVKQATAVAETHWESQHLRRVLKEKSEIEYSGREPRPDDAAALCDHARKFVEFVRRSLEAKGS